ncbi:MAG: hypothetical protein MUO73_02120, partial [Thermoplasmata archaeon]|nr:hypothetical protein [Thermoplasmata archaeon]
KLIIEIIPGNFTNIASSGACKCVRQTKNSLNITSRLNWLITICNSLTLNNKGYKNKIEIISI